MTSNWVFFKDLLTGRLVKQYNSVYSIHTFSRSKGVNIEMINQVNCQSDTLLVKISYNVSKEGIIDKNIS